MEKKLKDAESGDDAAKIAAAAEIMKEAEAKQKEFEPLSKAFEEFSNIAEKNPVAKKLMEDKAFEQEMKKEFNLPEEMF
jgi:CHAT domain-containing protein